MSHVTPLELQVLDLEVLKTSCEKLGINFIENQKTYKWYGHWVGDYPMPEGFKKEDLGKCDHAISVPGARYEIGVVKKGNEYKLMYDFWREGGLHKQLGNNLGKLKQMYTIQKTLKECGKNKMYVKETKLENNKVQLRIRVK